MKRLFLVLTSIISFSAIPLSAQMTKPSFGPELEKLSFIVGQFSTTTNIRMGDNSSTSSGYIKAHWALDSMFVLFMTSENNPMMGQYEGFGVLGYDSRTSEYALSMFNNYGERIEYKGNFSGDTLMLKSQIASPQGTFEQELKWFKSGVNVRLVVLNDFGDGMVPMIDQTAVPDSGGMKSEDTK